MPNSESLTVTAQGGVLRVINTACSVSPAFNPALNQGTAHPPFCDFTAIWDTGATASVITQKVVDACNLKPTGMTQAQTAGELRTVETYLINIRLPHGVGFQEVPVTKMDLGSSADVLIGMDIITIGDFSITNKDGITVFSFRTPSQLHVDYVKEHNAALIRERLHHGGSKDKRKKRPKTFGKDKRK